jgi:TonB family protein
MITGAPPTISLSPPAKRSVPRYKLSVPLDLTVLRSGIPDNVPGRTLEIGEGGMGVVVASQLLLGESVRVEFLLPHTNSPVKATAVVRYQRELCCGLQFIRLPLEQRSAIRYWTRCEAALSLVPPKNQPACLPSSLEEGAGDAMLLPKLANPEASQNRFRIRHMVAIFAPIVLLATLGWWQWEQDWRELEAQIPAREPAVANPQWKIPPDIMQRRITHRVTPEYPQDARRAGVDGTVVLDTVVSGEGAVTQLRFVSGPEVLSQAAMNAVRWWRFEPFLVNGQPATVETTVAVDFRLHR